MFFCPVLGRPHHAHGLVQTWITHSPHPLRLLVQAGDPAASDYLRLVDDLYDQVGHQIPQDLVAAIVIPRSSRGTCSALNFAFSCLPHLGYYGFVGEDCRLTTPNVHLIHAVGHHGIAFPDDGFHGPNLCTHPVIGGELVRDVGFFALPTLFHNFFDTTWYSIGKRLKNLVYCPEVRLDHIHPLNTGAPLDEVQELGQSVYGRDEIAYKNFLEVGLDPLVDRLLN